jgi:hypothetical protein
LIDLAPRLNASAKPSAIKPVTPISLKLQDTTNKLKLKPPPPPPVPPKKEKIHDQIKLPPKNRKIHDQIKRPPPPPPAPPKQADVTIVEPPTNLKLTKDTIKKNQ